MRWLWKLVFLTVLCGCDYITKKDPPDNKKQEKQSLANKVRAKAASSLKTKYGLLLAGTGGQMMYEIEKLMLIVDYPKPLTQEEGRELIINAVNEFVGIVNEEEAIHQYLANYPFTPKNVEVSIFLKDQEGKRVQPDSFILVEESDGFIRFIAPHPETQRFHTVHRETFEEAQQMVNQSTKTHQNKSND